METQGNLAGQPADNKLCELREQPARSILSQATADANRRHQYDHRRTLKGTISNKLAYSKKHARAKGLECSITNADLTQLWEQQGGKCALSGVPLGYIGSGWSAASVDRKDPSQGYVAGNIQWVCWRVNDAKSNMNNDDFIAMCKAIAVSYTGCGRCNDYSFGK